jgi:hypothetical protein
MIIRRIEVMEVHFILALIELFNIPASVGTPRADQSLHSTTRCRTIYSIILKRVRFSTGFCIPVVRVELLRLMHLFLILSGTENKCL